MTLKRHWIPERKFLAGGVAGLVTWLLTLAASAAGVAIPPDLMTATVGLVMGAVYYMVPPAAEDVLRRIDGDLKATFEAPEIRGTVAKLALAFLLLGGIAFGGPTACASLELSRAEATTPAQRVYALQADYNTALIAAVGYVESDFATDEARSAIARLDRIAYQAIKSAGQAVRSGDHIATAVSLATARSALNELIAYVDARRREAAARASAPSVAASGAGS
jgi:hypothetical protein